MPTKQQFKVGLVQMAMSARPEDNVAKAVAKVREAAGRGAEVVCLPELFRTPYFCQKEDHALFDLAEPVPGPTTEALGRVGEGSGRRGGRPHLRAAGARASTTTARSSSTPTARSPGLYRKMHIPDDPLFYEKFYFTPGDLGFQAFD